MLLNAFWGQMKAHDMLLRYSLYENLTFIFLGGMEVRGQLLRVLSGLAASTLIS